MEINLKKDHHSYNKEYIGDSDIAALLMVGCSEDGLKSEIINYGEDASYSAYIVDADSLIPEHYKLVASFECWLKVYDDEVLTNTFRADKINIYRSGMRGTIIQLLNF
ncbi:MAG: hypothetical protein MJ232_03115 [archaeon]|nr:hypothetical protein [archaeon]